MRLKEKDDVNTVLAVNGATLTDNYWVKSSDSLATYEEIRFKDNLFDKLALCGDPDSYVCFKIIPGYKGINFLVKCARRFM